MGNACHARNRFASILLRLSVIGWTYAWQAALPLCCIVRCKKLALANGQYVVGESLALKSCRSALFSAFLRFLYVHVKKNPFWPVVWVNPKASAFCQLELIPSTLRGSSSTPFRKRTTNTKNHFFAIQYLYHLFYSSSTYFNLPQCKVQLRINLWSEDNDYNEPRRRRSITWCTSSRRC